MHKKVDVPLLYDLLSPFALCVVSQFKGNATDCNQHEFIVMRLNFQKKLGICINNLTAI